MHDLNEVPKIEFDPEDVEFDIRERFRLWAALEPWFQQHGYYLYSRSHNEDGTLRYSYPRMVFSGKDEFPFAHLGGDENVPSPSDVGDEPRPDLPAFSSTGTQNALTHPAQDFEGRHLFIKLVKGGSEEYKITRFLKEQSSCAVGLIPILALLPYDGHWFVVTPRWNDSVRIPWFSTMAEILHLMKCLLEGLAFLHEHRIFHRDINECNMLVNHVPRNLSSFYSGDNSLPHRQLRAAGHLTYCLFDFDLSLMLPVGKPLSDYRLPINESFSGVHYKPYGVEQAQLDFNPFAYDVGCLGNSFCDLFQYCTPIIPMLAPLIDGMITRNIKARFTAAEALEFLETFRNQLDAEVLARQPTECSIALRSSSWDRWAVLPKDFVNQWSMYRDPPPTYYSRLLQKICDHDFGWRTVSMLRRVGRNV